jgi:hypothetical protein
MLGYSDHYVVDGGKAIIILSALVTPGSIMDSRLILDLVDWVRFRWMINPKPAVSDTKYGSVPNIVLWVWKNAGSKPLSLSTRWHQMRLWLTPQLRFWRG